jgi:hypothetical protein
MVEFVKEHIIYRFGQSSESLLKAWESNYWILLLIKPKLMVKQRLLTRSWSRLYKRKLIRSLRGGIRYSMRLCGLTEWPLMELQKHLLMSWFMGIMLFCPEKYNQIRGEWFCKRI